MLTKAQTIHIGMELGVDYTLTNSCYNPKIIPKEERDGSGIISIPCGVCDSCILRGKGFSEYNRKKLKITH